MKLIEGGAQEPVQSPELKRESYWDYAWMFATSGIIWAVIGYWVWQYFKNLLP